MAEPSSNCEALVSALEDFRGELEALRQIYERICESHARNASEVERIQAEHYPKLVLVVPATVEAREQWAAFLSAVEEYRSRALPSFIDRVLDTLGRHEPRIPGLEGTKKAVRESAIAKGKFTFGDPASGGSAFDNLAGLLRDLKGDLLASLDFAERPSKTRGKGGSQSPPPQVAARRAIVDRNPRLKSQDLCKRFDEGELRVPRDWNADSWHNAYQNPALRARIHTMVSKDRKRLP